MPNRTIVFLGHANPEDNTFTQWLSLKLAALGYQVWSDVTKLLGGEDFWRDIEPIIRNGTVKYLYVLSRASNHKLGALRELRVANADIHTVLNDVLALTKLNYNACIYGDGQPVTLSFADAVGEILTAGPVAGAPTPFKLYI